MPAQRSSYRLIVTVTAGHRAVTVTYRRPAGGGCDRGRGSHGDTAVTEVRLRTRTRTPSQPRPPSAAVAAAAARRVIGSA